MSAKVPLYQPPVPSTDFAADATLCPWAGYPTLRFSYDRDGTAYRSGIRFKRVLATRTRSERCCTEWHIQDAYDTLVEVRDSSWLAEIRADIPSRWRDEQELHHYMIYLDSAGCFEVVAESWEAIPEEAGSWEST
jgi:hypothetical protein